MTTSRIEIGTIIHNNQKFIVYWDSINHEIWVKDEKGYLSHYNHTKTKNPGDASKLAIEMLIDAGH